MHRKKENHAKKSQAEFLANECGFKSGTAYKEFVNKLDHSQHFHSPKGMPCFKCWVCRMCFDKKYILDYHFHYIHLNYREVSHPNKSYLLTPISSPKVDLSSSSVDTSDFSPFSEENSQPQINRFQEQEQKEQVIPCKNICRQHHIESNINMKSPTGFPKIPVVYDGLSSKFKIYNDV